MSVSTPEDTSALTLALRAVEMARDLLRDARTEEELRLRSTLEKGLGLIPTGPTKEQWRVTARPPKGKDGHNWQLRYFPPPGEGRPGRLGKPYQRSAGTADEAEAWPRARRREAEINGTSLGLLEVLQAHIEFRQRDPGTRPTTVRNYKAAARRARTYFDANATLTKASAELARDLMREDLSSNTINVDFAMIGHAWNWAYDRDLVSKPWPKLRRLPEQDTERRPCTAGEAAAILEQLEGIDDGRFSPLFRLLAEAGSRLGETLCLREADLDREAGQVTFRAETTKAKRARSAHVLPEVLEAIPRAGTPEALVFPGANGGALHATTAGAAWRRAMKAAGLEGEPLTIHSLRRGWITDALEAGVPLPHVMKQVGHRDPSTTLSYQRRATNQDLDSSARRVADFRARETA